MMDLCVLGFFVEDCLKIGVVDRCLMEVRVRIWS